MSPRLSTVNGGIDFLRQWKGRGMLPLRERRHTKKARFPDPRRHKEGLKEFRLLWRNFVRIKFGPRWGP